MRYLIDSLALPEKFDKLYRTNSSYKYFYFCNSCGSELYSEYHYPLHDSTSWARQNRLEHTSDMSREESIELWEIKEERKQIDALQRAAKERYHTTVNMEKCPVCGAELSREKGFFSPDRGVGHYTDDIFKQLAVARETEERDQATADANAYVTGCDLFVAANTPAKASEIKGNLDALKQYILHLIQLENSIYSLKQRLSELYYQRVCNDRSIVYSLHEPAYRIKMELEELRSAYQEALEAASAAEKYQPKIQYPDPPIKPTLYEPALLTWRRDKKENEEKKAKYKAEVEEYRNECKRCDEEKARLIAEAIEKAQKNAEEAKERLEEIELTFDERIKTVEVHPTPANSIKKLLDKEIAETEDLLKKTVAARNELYAYDIIFGKYRDVVSLSSFYEYLMSGRCSSLEGADGAYNIYESEIRANRVIAQLDTVISSLEDIKQNQYMMYQELQKINSSLHSLNSTMDQALTSIRGIEANTTQMTEYMEHISQNSDVIAHNTAVTAYYSKVNAELTNALGFMVALK